MISARKPARAAATSESAVSRRLGDLRDIAAILKRSGLSPLETCRVVVDGGALDLKTRAFFAGLPAEEKHYWIASLYALLMPEARRRKLAAYFTPPHLATHAIAILARAGIALPSSIACYNIYTQRFVALLSPIIRRPASLSEFLMRLNTITLRGQERPTHTQ
jgi:hypothetical protein